MIDIATVLIWLCGQALACETKAPGQSVWVSSVCSVLPLTLGNLADRQHYQHALTLYTDLGWPEADQIRIHLATLDQTPPADGDPG